MNRALWKQKYRNSFLARAIRRVGGDEKGVAAVEFAIVLPLLLTLYLGTMEASQALDSYKKVSRSSSMVADMITQQSTITRAELVAITEISESLLLPYKRSKPEVEMVGIRITNDNPPKSEVEWSLKRSAGGGLSKPYGEGSAISVPNALKTPGTFLVRAKVKMKYKPMTTWSLQGEGSSGKINMEKMLHLRPRLVGIVECTDC